MHALAGNRPEYFSRGSENNSECFFARGQRSFAFFIVRFRVSCVIVPESHSCKSYVNNNVVATVLMR